MDPTLAAAAIGVGGTVVVGVAGFSASIWNTRRTIASGREGRLWDKRAPAYEGALIEIVIRATKRNRWLNSSSQTWTAENTAEYAASQETPEWSAAQGRLLAYGSQQVLMALGAARSASESVSQAFDRVAEGIEAGESEIAAGTLTPDKAREQVWPLLEAVRHAVGEVADREDELVDLMQTELQGPAKHGPGRLKKAADDADDEADD
jgi:hypothetical protein